MIVSVRFPLANSTFVENEWLKKKKKEKHHQPTTDCHCGLVFGSISSRVWLALLWLYPYTSPLHNETPFKTKLEGRQQLNTNQCGKKNKKEQEKSSPYTVGKQTKKRQAAKESMVERPTGQERNGWFSPSFVSRSDTVAKFICFGRRSKRCWNVCRVFFSQRNANIQNAAYFLSSAHRRPSRMR